MDVRLLALLLQLNKNSTPNPKRPKKTTNKNLSTQDIFADLTDQEREIVANKTAYADQQGITDPLHRQNLINQALQQHRQAEQAQKEQKEREKAERQAKKAKKQAEQQAKAKAKAEQEKAQQTEQRRSAMIAKFESLPSDKQEQILDQVAENIDGMFAKVFKTARASGTAHKDIMFFGWFF